MCKSNFSNVNLSGVSLFGVYLEGVNLEGVNFSYFILDDVVFNKVNLINVILEGVFVFYI